MEAQKSEKLNVIYSSLKGIFGGVGGSEGVVGGGTDQKSKATPGLASSRGDGRGTGDAKVYETIAASKQHVSKKRGKVGPCTALTAVEEVRLYNLPKVVLETGVGSCEMGASRRGPFGFR